MALDMKAEIAEAAARLLIEKNKKKITVRDIVDECHITRQAFYYHFADIPELMEWIITQRMQETEAKLEAMDDPEERLKYLFLMTLNACKGIEKGLQSNYGKELEQILHRRVHGLFACAAEHAENVPQREREILVRYHCSAIIGLLADWTDEDTKNMDQIVHVVYQTMTRDLKCE